MSVLYKPVIIIGAPRSGTNMLRDVLTALPGVGTWPCDEINYIWRHGNVRYPSDEFTSDMVKTEVSDTIHQSFDWVAHKYHAQTVVEKTCANSLRMEYVDSVMPDAKYIFIRRNGLDVVSSAMKRWKASLDIPYLMRKARFVPLSDLPYYASRYLGNRLYRLISQEERLAFWGPKLDNIDILLNNYSLDEVCALQWKRCVDKAVSDLNKISNHRWIEIGYEEFVTDPETKFESILQFLGIHVSKAMFNEALKDVSPYSIGKGRKSLGKETVSRLMPLIEDTMFRYGYE